MGARWPVLLLAATVCIAMGLCSYWVVVEKDLFLMMTIGREILSTGTLPHTDTWSSTAAGRPWTTYQWLTGVVFEVVGRITPHLGALSAFRSFLVSIPFLALIPSVLREKNRFSALLAFATLSCVLHVICAERFFLRAELLGFSLCFVPMVALWESKQRPITQIWVSLALLVLWSNFHGGTAPFGILLLGFYVLSLPAREFSLLFKAGYCILAVLTWFATPIGFKVVPVTLNNSMGVDWSIMMNMDHLPLLPSHFDIATWGFTYPLWGLLSVLGLTILARNGKTDPKAKALFFFTFALTALTVLKVRARIYPSAILVFPLLTQGARWIRPTARGYAIGAVVLGVFGVYPLWDEAAHVMPRFGSEVAAEQLPIETVRFLKEHHPAGVLFNAYDFGGYVEYEAGDLYKVSTDGRALPFMEFEKSFFESQKTPQAFQEMLTRHAFSIVLEQFPFVRFTPESGYADQHHLWFPKEEWALVSFDNASVVYLRRNAGNDPLITQFEYHALVRDRPPNFGTDDPDATGEERARFRKESETCLERCPSCSYCRIALACFLKKEGKEEEGSELLRSPAVRPFTTYDARTVFAACGR